MKIGVVFPNDGISPDPSEITAYVEGIEALDMDFMTVSDHVIGANPDRDDWEGVYDFEVPFHEALTLFAYTAQATETIDLISSILIVPQRQTVLLAKQAAEVDVLSGGRLQLGIGVGWNEIEFEALDVDFSTRGKRIEEQVDVLRNLWEHRLVTYRGDWHTISDAGLNPLPHQRPIPIWMGGDADIVLDRTARLADGWMARSTHSVDTHRERIQKLEEFEERADRDTDLRKMTRIHLAPNDRFAVARDPHDWVDLAGAFDEMGFTHLALDSRYADLDGYQAHMDVAQRFRQVLDEAGLVD